MRELPLQHHLMLEYGRGPVRLFRRNAGQAWQGRGPAFVAREPCVRRLNPGDVVLTAGTRIRLGMEGEPDLQGWVSRRIVQADVGSLVAIYLGAEVKGDGTRVQPEQERFLSVLRAAGGIGGIVRSSEDMRRLIAGETID